MKAASPQSKLSSKLSWIIAAIFIIAPLYTPLSVLLASHVQHFDLLKIWKEVALTILGLVLTGFLFTHRRLAHRVLSSWILITIGLYIIILSSIGVFDLITRRVTTDAVIYGLLVDLRPAGFFAVTLLVFTLINQKKLRSFSWKKVILWPAAFVVLFGFLQFSVLPKDTLTHIGYGKSTIQPYGTIDNQPNLVRIESTLRGPNPLGAYLLLITTLLTAILLAAKGRERLLWAGFVLGALAVLYSTYSRSAELGLAVSLIVLLVVYQREFFRRHLAIVLAGSILLLGVGIFAAASKNYLAQNVLFHSSNKSTSRISSNAERIAAIKRGVDDVAHNPLGNGVGSAGPASLRNKKSQPKIAENYYLQIGQEIGWAGMTLFAAINILIGIELWHRRQDMLARVLLASLVGLTIVNMLSHAWTDDTLAYIWWGLAGVALAPAILTDRRKKNEKTKQSTA